MQLVTAMGKLETALQEFKDKKNDYDDYTVFIVENGAFARREAWPKKQCIFPTSLLSDSESFLVDKPNYNKDIKVDYIMTGIPAETDARYDIYEPTFEDTVADDWVVAMVTDKVNINRYKEN